MKTKEIKIPGISTYYGGKGSSGTYQTIINEIPPHDVRIIPFLGNCAITRHMEPAKTMFLYDLDSSITQAWSKSVFGSMQGVSIVNLCGITALEYLSLTTADTTQNVFMYLDPPYPLDSRKNHRDIYSYEMSMQDHKRMLSAVHKISTQPNVKIAISTYYNDTYHESLKEWRLVKFESMTRHGMATEYLYMNYDITDGLLHDYSYVGDDYRRREQIKIKINRLTQKLSSMPSKERKAIIESIKHL